jgi:uronate dehydrogenase
LIKVALSGATGGVGRVLRPFLLKQNLQLRSAGYPDAPEPLVPGEDVMGGDLRDPAVVDRMLDGVDVLLHLAGTSVERPLPEIIENNLVGLVAVYEGARRQGVKRIVFASSNHAFGMYGVDEKITLDADYRPDCFYGLSKAWGEALARMYWDKHGIEGISMRIGSILERPTEPRHLSTWFGYEDMFRLMMGCIETPDVGYMAVWGLSNNTRAYWTPLDCERLGFRPVQNAEDYAADVLSRPNPLGETAQRFQGGGFVMHDYTPPDQRPHARRG